MVLTVMTPLSSSSPNGSCVRRLRELNTVDHARPADTVEQELQPDPTAEPDIPHPGTCLEF